MYVCFVPRKHNTFRTNQHTEGGVMPQRESTLRGGGVCKHSISDLLPQPKARSTKPLFTLQIPGKIIATRYLKMLRKPPHAHLCLWAWLPGKQAALWHSGRQEKGAPERGPAFHPGRGAWLRPEALPLEGTAPPAPQP